MSERTDGTVERALNGFVLRSIGPYRGGRVVAVAGHPVDTRVFYMGSTGGGVWKTTDGGIIWTNVSDGFFKRASVGAIAVAPSDPNVVYVGMGETCIRSNVSLGDGVYRSADGGRTWVHRGLARTRNIGKLRVDPRDPNTVYVAALGHVYGPNRDRGLYRTRDGGTTWQLVLYRGPRAGAIDVAFDPSDPRTLYCSTWEARRTPWSVESGGPRSGLWKSADGGDTWSEISRSPGLPTGVLGKIGIAVSPAKPDRVYAMVEAHDGAVFRSDDGGRSWVRCSEDRNLRTRAFYYHHIFADPLDADVVWVLNADCWRSADGGRTFAMVATPHTDNHDLWIDPHDPNRMILGCDGGAAVTFSRGESWSPSTSQATAEMYHVTTDNRVPYHVYGGQQDGSSIAIPSRSRFGAAITSGETYAVGGGESGHIAVQPDDPDIVFAGSHKALLTRYDHRSGQVRNIQVRPETTGGWPAADLVYRFNWSFPIIISPFTPHALYVAGNCVFRSTDEGTRWTRISPDLTRNDKDTQQHSGGPITPENGGSEYYGTISTLAASPKKRGLLWAGSDDGRIHRSDGGRTWVDVTPKALVPYTFISCIEPSPHDAGTAYVAATRHQFDDLRPLLLKTVDSGRSWRPISRGIARDDFTRVIRADPEQRGLLYAGTETGLYVSFDDGRRWRRLQANLPIVPVHDLTIKNGDLIVATHGRGFWILDDVTALREDFAQAASRKARLFDPRAAFRPAPGRGFGFAQPAMPGLNYRQQSAAHVTWRPAVRSGERGETLVDAGQGPPDGVLVYYLLGGDSTEEVTLTFVDRSGHDVISFSSLSEGDAAARVPARAGLNRFVWNTQYPAAVRLEGFPPDASIEGAPRALRGPMALPGRYSVRLRVGRQTMTAPFEIRLDPSSGATKADLKLQFDLLVKLRDKLTETHEAVNRLARLRERLERLAAGKGERIDTQSRDELGSVTGLLNGIEATLIQPKAKTRLDTYVFPVRLNAKLGGLVARVASADFAPTYASRELFDELCAKVDAEIAALREVELHRVPRLELRLTKTPRRH